MRAEVQLKGEIQSNRKDDVLQSEKQQTKNENEILG